MYYGYKHCAYAVLLDSGKTYIVDPTGIQYGPEWPLVCEAVEYVRRFFAPYDNQLKWDILGTNAALAGDIRRIEN